MCRCERWRTDTFELWCWRRLLRVPWAARRSKQSILKEINPEYSLEGLMLKLKLQWFGQLMRRTGSGSSLDLIRKDPDAGKDWRREDKGTTEDEMVGWHHRLKGREFEQALGESEGPGSLACCSPWFTKSQTQLNWSPLRFPLSFFSPSSIFFVFFSLYHSTNVYWASSFCWELSFQVGGQWIVSTLITPHQ